MVAGRTNPVGLRHVDERNAENPEAKSGPRAASYYLGSPGGRDGGVLRRASHKPREPRRTQDALSRRRFGRL